MAAMPQALAAAASADRIPADALFDALLPLPARDLCRLRDVSRSWRGLISDPVFVAAHGSRHPGPHLLAKFTDDKTNSFHVVDLAGGVVKRIACGGPYHQLLRTRLDLACLATDFNRCSVVNPATGAVHVLPEPPAPEHANRVSLSNPYTFFALGRVAATGEHKVLRMFNRLGFDHGGQQVFDVFTVNGDARWRGRQAPGLYIDERSGTTVDGVVHFLTNRRVYDGLRCGIRPDYIVSFDLGLEEWRRDLRGPISNNAGDGKKPFYRKRRQHTLAELNGYLVDFGSGLWVKQYSIKTRSLISRSRDGYQQVKPLLVLGYGRLLVFVGGRLFICDTGTSTFEPLNMVGSLDSVAVYTGNLLSLE